MLNDQHESKTDFSKSPLKLKQHPSLIQPSAPKQPSYYQQTPLLSSPPMSLQSPVSLPPTSPQSTDQLTTSARSGTKIPSATAMVLAGQNLAPASSEVNTATSKTCLLIDLMSPTHKSALIESPKLEPIVEKKPIPATTMEILKGQGQENAGDNANQQRINSQLTEQEKREEKKTIADEKETCKTREENKTIADDQETGKIRVCQKDSMLTENVNLNSQSNDTSDNIPSWRCMR